MKGNCLQGSHEIGGETTDTADLARRNRYGSVKADADTVDNVTALPRLLTTRQVQQAGSP